MDLALTIIILVGVVALIWLLVELAFLVRRTRSKVSDVADNVNGVIQQAETTLKKLDPAIEELEPLVEKVQTTVDAASLDLLHINEILGDVGTMTGAASKATDAVTGAFDKAAGALKGVADKITGKSRKEKKLEAKELEELPDADVEVSDDEQYFTYNENSE